ncbi:hypothetical protein IGI04_030446, partial [Brassica rapa subsp. trilocularis]
KNFKATAITNRTQRVRLKFSKNCYVATDPQTSRSQRSDRPSHSVHSDRPNLLFGRYQRGPGRYVETKLSRTSINGYDPNPCILPYHFSHHSDQSYHRNFTIKTTRTCFCRKENCNKRFMSKDSQRSLKRDYKSTYDFLRMSL